jgi:exonuclease SbcC
LSDRHGAPELKAAEAALERARVAAAGAAAACRTAERAATEAAGRLDRERDRIAQAESTLADEDRRLAEIEAGLVADLGGRLPADPIAELERRASELRGLAADLEARRAAAISADETLRTIDRLLGEARGQLSTEGARLDALPLDDLVARAVAAGLVPAASPATRRNRSRRSARAAVGATTAVAPTALAEPPERLPVTDPASLATAALAIADRLDGLTTGCAIAVAERTATEGGLLDEARLAVGDLAPPSADLVELGGVAEAANAAAIGEAAVTARRVADLEERIARRAELEAEIDALRERGARFKQLALELRQDRIVAFLQEEALAILATAGSVHLEELSSGRYRLEVVDDEFLVVDTWNGEERRSVKTLSGGESFLASLGLALALSEQVPSLAANARSRVTSLFLDEGFGTLDEETLQVVIGAVEVLGGDDRIVGVVTHVAELAERLPARIVVEKSPRGSTIRRV